MFHLPEEFRVQLKGMDNSLPDAGAFVVVIQTKISKTKLFCIASSGMGWEHVSVSVEQAKRCPVWDEMCAVKDLFWDEEDCVVQYHPPKSDYVSNHPFVLHLWRPVGVDMIRPPAILVGIKQLGDLSSKL